MFILGRFDAIGERNSAGLTNINSQFLAMLGRRIKAIEESKLSIEGQRAAAQKELELFLRELKREGERAAKKTQEIYTEAAKRANAIPVKVAAKFGTQAMTEGALEQIVRTVSAITEGTFYNLGRTKAAGIRISRADGRVFYESLSQAYIRIVDDAISRMAMGTTSYQAEVRRGLKEVADSGIRIIDYESGYSRRMDSALRQNITDGVRSIAEQISAENGRKFGADGVEIDAHNYCAPDHLPYQGRMFSNEEYAKIEESLDRKFMTWNCRHLVMPVILGVSTPLYTEEERQAMHENSTRKFTFDGKEYTGYEGTQLQRRLETEIRKSKDRSVLFAASGDDTQRRVEQTRINVLKHKYMDVSKTFGLPYAKDRMGVSGFRAVKPQFNWEAYDLRTKIDQSFELEGKPKYSELFVPQNIYKKLQGKHEIDIPYLQRLNEIVNKWDYRGVSPKNASATELYKKIDDIWFTAVIKDDSKINGYVLTTLHRIYERKLQSRRGLGYLLER